MLTSWLFLEHTNHTPISRHLHLPFPYLPTLLLQIPFHGLILHQLYIFTWMSSFVRPSLTSYLTKATPSHTKILPGPSFIWATGKGLCNTDIYYINTVQYTILFLLPVSPQQNNKLHEGSFVHWYFIYLALRTGSGILKVLDEYLLLI